MTVFSRKEFSVDVRFGVEEIIDFVEDPECWLERCLWVFVYLDTLPTFYCTRASVLLACEAGTNMLGLSTPQAAIARPVTIALFAIYCSCLFLCFTDRNTADFQERSCSVVAVVSCLCFLANRCSFLDFIGFASSQVTEIVFH